MGEIPAHAGRVAVLNSSMLSLSDRKRIIYGTKGFIIFENINNFESLTVYDLNRREIKHIDCQSSCSKLHAIVIGTEHYS